MMAKRLSVSIIFLILAYNAFPQIVINNLLDKNIYNARIKLVDEFFDRFNLKEMHPDKNENDSSFKENNLLALFNYDYLIENKDSLMNTAVEFINKIISDSIRIDYSDTAWYASAKCKGKFKGKSVDFNLCLSVEKRGEDMYKWVIKKAEGDIFSLTPAFASDQLMLYPDDHETNFMSLKRITTERDDIILNYADKEFLTDETSVFYSLVYYGLLDIEYVADLQFVFRQVEGYEFTIKNFNRETTNAGWLINSLKKINE